MAQEFCPDGWGRESTTISKALGAQSSDVKEWSVWCQATGTAGDWGTPVSAY